MSEVKTRQTWAQFRNDYENAQNQRIRAGYHAENLSPEGAWNAALANVIMPEMMSEAEIIRFAKDALDYPESFLQTRIVNKLAKALAGKIPVHEPVPSAGGLTRERIIQVLNDLSTGSFSPDSVIVSCDKVADALMQRHPTASDEDYLNRGKIYQVLSTQTTSDAVESIFNRSRKLIAATEARVREEILGPKASLPDFEDALETAFWEFDAKHKATSGPSERDAFKQVLRGLFDMGLDPTARGLRAELLARRMECESQSKMLIDLRTQLAVKPSLLDNHQVAWEDNAPDCWEMWDEIQAIRKIIKDDGTRGAPRGLVEAIVQERDQLRADIEQIQKVLGR